MFSIGRRNVRRGCCPVQVCSNAHSAGKRFRTITTSPIMSSTNFPRCRSSTCAWGRARGCRTQHKCRLGEGHRAQAYQYRTGTDADAPQIQKIILSQMMNPLGLQASRFVIAYTDTEPVVGFGQVVPQGPESAELRSLFVKPEHREAGVGKDIVQQLVERSEGVELYVLSPANRCRFYEKAGFKALAPWEVPGFLRFEIIIGAVILFIVERTGIIGMVYDPTSSSAE